MNVLSAMLSALIFTHLCPKQAKMKPNKHKASHTAEREFGGALGEPLFVVYNSYMHMFVYMSYWIYCVMMIYGFCAIFEIICSPHLSRCHLHPCVPASDCSVPPECVSVSSSQCPAVASSSNPCSTVMGPFGRGCDCRLDHPAKFSLPAAHWEGERRIIHFFESQIRLFSEKSMTDIILIHLLTGF